MSQEYVTMLDLAQVQMQNADLSMQRAAVLITISWAIFTALSIVLVWNYSSRMKNIQKNAEDDLSAIGDMKEEILQIRDEIIDIRKDIETDLDIREAILNPSTEDGSLIDHEKKSSTSKGTIDYSKSVEVQQILSEYRQINDFERDPYESRIKDVPVHAVVEYIGASKVENSIYRIQFKIDNSSYVFAVLDVQAHPHIKMADQGDRYNVSGTIDSISDYSVVIKCEDLSKYNEAKE